MPDTGINRAAVSFRLAALIEHGVLERDPPEARRAQYRLTQAGRELVPVIGAMCAWGDEWLFDKPSPGG